MPIYYKEIGENVAFSSFVLLLLAIYFGISIYFSKKEDYYHPYEADYQEWLEGKNEEIWTGLD